MIIEILGSGLVREQVSWIKPESQRTEPGQRPKAQQKKGRSLYVLPIIIQYFLGRGIYLLILNFKEIWLGEEKKVMIGDNYHDAM